MYDILIIGAGVCGCSIARELSRYQAKICVIEKNGDVCTGVSKANTGIVYPGYDGEPGSIRSQMNCRGSEMMPQLAKELDFDYKQVGMLMVRTDEVGLEKLEKNYKRGMKNHVPGLVWLDHDQLLEIEPGLTDEVIDGVFAPNGAVVDPFGLTIAMAENAYSNGVEFKFDTEVLGIEKSKTEYILHTNQGDLQSRVVINAAGLYADDIHNMISDEKIQIEPKRGDYIVLDSAAKSPITHIVKGMNDVFGKGVILTPTIFGNLMIGPTAMDEPEKENNQTMKKTLDHLLNRCDADVDHVPKEQVITAFAGLRPRLAEEKDYRIGMLEDAPGFVDCAGIKLPGLTCAPAIGVKISEIVSDYLALERKSDFNAVRKGPVRFSKMSLEEKAELIKADSSYGRIICRCQQVTEGEIRDAIRGPLGARSVDGVKRRTHAGMGRCQAGFCLPRVIDILAEELGIDKTQVQKKDSGSEFLIEKIGQ